MFVNLKIFVGYIPSMKYLLFIHMLAQSGSVGGSNKQNKNKKNSLNYYVLFIYLFYFLTICLLTGT